MPIPEFKASEDGATAVCGEISVRLAGFQDLIYSKGEKVLIFEHEPLLENGTVVAYSVFPRFGWTWQERNDGSEISSAEQIEIQDAIRGASRAMDERIVFPGERM